MDTNEPNPTPAVEYQDGDLLFPELLGENFLRYAVSVLTDRALPDIRDGLLPVQRRILLAMNDLRLRPTGAHRKCAKVVGECFVEGTLVHTPTGLTPIEQLNVGDLVTKPNGETTTVDKTFHNAPQQLVTVRLSNGTVLDVTPGQLFKTLGNSLVPEWTRAEDLVGKRVLSSQHIITPTLPIDNGDAAYAAGLFVAEGFPRDRRFVDKDQKVVITMADCEPLDRVERYARATETFSSRKEKLPTRAQDKTMETLRVSGNTLLIEACKAVSRYKKVPANIIADKTQYIPFIAGLIDGDGYVRQQKGNRNKHEIVIVSTSIELLSQVRSMALALGMHGSVLEHGPLQKDHHQPYCLRFSGRHGRTLARQLNGQVQISRKRDELQLMENEEISSSSLSDKIPAQALFAELTEAHIGSGWFYDANGEKFRMGLKHGGNRSGIRYSADRHKSTMTVERAVSYGMQEKLARIGSPLAETLNELSGQTYLTVVDVQEGPVAETYDIRVTDDEHAMIVEGCIVHNCMGNYHPHGDGAIYGAMVRMAQDFSLRAPLIDGQGNFGNLDGDGAAASRYTECRMTPAAEALMGSRTRVGEREVDALSLDVMPNDFGRNYDESRAEALVMPAAYPNLLVNGNFGIAVGMTCRMLPHNPGEVIDLTIWRIANPTATVEKLAARLSGPDFPTGALVVNDENLRQTYITGEGKVLSMGEAYIEPMAGNRERIIITSLPYNVAKGSGGKGTGLLEIIANQWSDGKYPEITEMNDESTNDTRIIIELKRGANARAVLQRLYKYTRLRETYGVAMNVLIDGRPQTVNVAQLIDHFLLFRREILVNAANKRIREIETRLHKLDAFLKAIDAIDAVVKTIRSSSNRQEAKPKLMKLLSIDEQQATWIVEMPLGNLTSLETKDLKEEATKLRAEVKLLKKFVKTPALIDEQIVSDLKELKKAFNSPRKTKVVAPDASGDIVPTDVSVPSEKCVLLITENGYALCGAGNLRRGASLQVAAGDSIVCAADAQTDQDWMVFTQSGKAFRVRLADLPYESKRHKGQHLSELVGIQASDKIVSAFAVDKDRKGFAGFAYASGLVKRTAWSEFASVVTSGTIAAAPKPGDHVIGVFDCPDDADIMLVGSHGKGIRFSAKDLRPMGRNAAGNRGIKIPAGATLIGHTVIYPTTTDVILLMDKAFAKRLSVNDIPSQGRDGGGVVLAKPDKKYGDPARIIAVAKEDELWFQQEGKLVEQPVAKVPGTSRAVTPKPFAANAGIESVIVRTPTT